MWRVYADRGFAVQTTFERIQIAFDLFRGEVGGAPVEYIDFSRETIPIGNVFTAVLKKDVPYRDEKEFRLLFWKLALANSAIGVGTNGVRVNVDLNKLIERIYVSPRLKTIPDNLARLVEAKNLECPIVSSVVRSRPA